MLILAFAPAFLVPVEGTTALSVRVAEAQWAYRACIVHSLESRPKMESGDRAFTAALDQCVEAELVLRRALRENPESNSAETLAVILDTRMEGQEEGFRRRDAR